LTNVRKIKELLASWAFVTFELVFERQAFPESYMRENKNLDEVVIA
jgi:hypothetical protein